MTRRRFRLLVAEPPVDERRLRQMLEPVADVVVMDASRGDLLSAVAEAEGLLVRLRHSIDDELVSVARRLRVIATPTTGLTHIDLDALVERDIVVISLQGQSDLLGAIVSTAELTLALMLILLRKLVPAIDSTRSGRWDRDAFRGTELSGKTIAIVGLGRLGTMVADRCAAFGAQVVAHDPYRARETDPTPRSVQRTEHLFDALAVADIVTLHASVAAGAGPILGVDEFLAMKRGACLINTARGELVDEAALLQALRSGHVGAAALDVLAGEPFLTDLTTHPLVLHARRDDNLIITPHLGGATTDAMRKTEEFACARLRSWIEQHVAE